MSQPAGILKPPGVRGHSGTVRLCARGIRAPSKNTPPSRSAIKTEPTGTSPIDYTPSGSHHWFLNAAQVVLPQPASQPAFRYACRPLQPEDPSRTPAAAHTY
ncbi:hypothetical protein PCANC_21860 [Puccinia coronata f. sp. avenae]|uniref:Uncharacterized protein n=1 Tax=Puccinia coronata f. sp. avenae TaxID=200324 RepID=A0A2N5SDU3_9BASI|nr:hypothetical protein PCANC_21860 [Puccinia coronata f. sp. avenae]